MKLGTENKKKTIVAIALMIVAIAVVVYQFTGGDSAEPWGTHEIVGAQAEAASVMEQAYWAPAETALARLVR